MILEDYLIENKSTIISMTKICKIIRDLLDENYWDIIKGKQVKRECIDEILSLNKVLLMILYCVRMRRKVYYRMIEPEYKDEFDYDTIID